VTEAAAPTLEAAAPAVSVIDQGGESGEPSFNDVIDSLVKELPADEKTTKSTTVARKRCRKTENSTKRSSVAPSLASVTRKGVQKRAHRASTRINRRFLPPEPSTTSA
jgi:hypothetical protein